MIRAAILRLATPRAALLLIVALLVLSVVGAVVPQASHLRPADVSAWQADNPLATRWLQALGFFDVFLSPVFLVIVAAFAVNTAACTITHLLGWRVGSSLPKRGRIDTWAFAVLHLSVITVCIGGFISGGFRMEGRMVITEGQTLQESRAAYTDVLWGPLCEERYGGFEVGLTGLAVERRAGRRTRVASEIVFADGEGQGGSTATVRVNEPVRVGNRWFTQDDTGYSPRIAVTHTASGRPMLDSYVALKTWAHPDERVYSDVLIVPFFTNKVFLSLYPNHVMIDGEPRRTGDVIGNPLLIVEELDDAGHGLLEKQLQGGATAEVGDYTLLFSDVRQWSSFGVSSDPGYPVVWVGLWTGLLALLLRYVVEIATWLKEPA